MSKYEDGLAKKMDLKNWPHLFTKTAREVQIGRDELTGDPIIAVEMTCIHCSARYINGQQNRPPDPCPARTQKTEMKRILS